MPKRNIRFGCRICCGILAGALLCTPLMALADETPAEDVTITVTDGAETDPVVPPDTGETSEDVPEQPGEGTEEQPDIDVGTEPIAISSISVPESVKLSVGKTKTISPELTPANATEEVTFQSSNPSVVTVSATGKLTAKKIGKATITVQAKSNPQVKAEIAVTIRLATPQNVHTASAEAGNAYMHVYWSKVDGAKTYIVYRQIKGGDWTKLATVTGTTYTDKNTQGGKTHSYRVVAVPTNSTYKSAKSAIYTVKLPVRPYGVKISSITDKGIEVYWKKPDNINGFEVYRSYSKNGTYTRITRINDETQGTYIDSKFNHNASSVYYKVRSFYINENGKRIYSKFSSVKVAKYRSLLKLERTQIFLRSGASRTLGVYYGWGDASSISWSTSDSSVATVTSKGKIKGVSAGTCTITCYSRSLKITRKCTVVVDRKPLSALSTITSVYKQNAEGCWYNPNSEASDQDNALIMMTGDMMCTGAQQTVQGYDTGNYNFNESFSEVRKLISGADFAIGNLETTLSSTWPYMHEEAYINNKPNCNAPSRYLDAVKYAGFDGVVMANNHNADAGIQGIKETNEQVDRYKLARTGVFSSKSDPRTLLVNVNGIKVGYLSYVSEVTGYNGKDADWSQSSKDTYLNYYTPEKAEKEIAELKERGAEYIIVYMHWGIKNAAAIKPSQLEAAQELADLGVDYIVGSHCHLLQPYELIQAKDGREVPCFYSLGDFQASVDQITGNRDSVILRIRLKRNNDGSIRLAQNNYISCYTYTKYNGKYYVTIPISSKLNGGKEITAYNTIHNRIVKAVGNKIDEYTGS